MSAPDPNDCPKCGCERHYGRCGNDGCDAQPTTALRAQLTDAVQALRIAETFIHEMQAGQYHVYADSVWDAFSAALATGALAKSGGGW